jgi:hypothetical protein
VLCLLSSIEGLTVIVSGQVPRIYHNLCKMLYHNSATYHAEDRVLVLGPATLGDIMAPEDLRPKEKLLRPIYKVEHRWTFSSQQCHPAVISFNRINMLNCSCLSIRKDNS